MPNYDQYSHYQTEDFLADADFKRWVVLPATGDNHHWERLLSAHPHLKSPLEQARLLILGLEASRIPFAQKHKDQLFRRVESQIGALEKSSRPTIRQLNLRLAAAVAAVFFLVGFGSYVYFFLHHTYQTDFGQTESHTLFDGSEVTLNANSLLEVPSRWDWRGSRAVRLEGEAYFVIKKLPAEENNRKFTVRTPEADVEVFGTQFNVYARRAQTKVLLDEGKVRVVEKRTRRALDISPGQLVEVDKKAVAPKIIDAPREKAEMLTTWKKNLLVFKDADMAELADRFEEIYGIRPVLKGEAFQNQQFQGELPIDNLDEALLILGTTFNQKPLRDGSRVYFVPRQ